MAKQRILELELKIHNEQPHLDRVIVAIKAITEYLEEREVADNAHCAALLAKSEARLINQGNPGGLSKPPSVPPIPTPPAVKP